MSAEYDDLLGAWALDALDPDERARLDASIAADAAARRTGDRMRGAVAAFAEGDATAPPAHVRAAVLDGARGRPLARAVPSDPVAAFRHQVAAFDEVVQQVAGEQWQLDALPYQWSLHGLVAHLLQIERYMQRALGLAEGPTDEFELDHLKFGARQIADEMTRSPASTVEAWREAVAAVDPHLDALDLDAGLVFHQWPFSISSFLVARSFELWTHADDIRRALGHPTVAPMLTDVMVMSDTSVRSLPFAIHVVSDRVPDGMARMVLTGPGGGVWDLQLGAGGPELVSVVAEAVDYCRLAARRVSVDSLTAVIEGDAALAERLLTAATIIAV